MDNGDPRLAHIRSRVVTKTLGRRDSHATSREMTKHGMGVFCTICPTSQGKKSRAMKESENLMQGSENSCLACIPVLSNVSTSFMASFMVSTVYILNRPISTLCVFKLINFALASISWLDYLHAVEFSRSNSITMPKEQKQRAATSLRKVHLEPFNFEWTDEFFFVQHGNLALCLVRNDTNNTFKRANLKGNFDVKHSHTYRDYTAGQRKTEAAHLQSRLDQQSSLSRKQVSKASE